MPRPIHIAAALLLDPQGRVLLVRKWGTTAFMQPGGKIEQNERPVQALVRELNEELGITVASTRARYLGQFSAPAANEPGYEVHCELFEVVIEGDVWPAAEIEEAVWVDVGQPIVLELAPLTRDHVLALTARGLH